MICVALIISHGSDHAPSLVDSLIQNTDLEIILIENGEKQWFNCDRLSVHYVPNRGYAHAFNTGLRITKTEGYEAVLILGHDVVVQDFSTLFNMIDTLQQGQADFVWHETKSEDTVASDMIAGSVDRSLIRSKLLTSPDEVLGAQNIYPNLSAACFLLTDGSCNLDERFFMYWEDVDLSFDPNFKKLRKIIFLGKGLIHRRAIQNNTIKKTLFVKIQGLISSYYFYKKYSVNRGILFFAANRLINHFRYFFRIYSR